MSGFLNDGDDTAAGVTIHVTCSTPHATNRWDIVAALPEQ
jgi:hypothetical protein